MPPPELPRNHPVANVAHPVEELLAPVLRKHGDFVALHRRYSLFSKRLHFAKPLRRSARLHNGLAALAKAHRQFVIRDFLE